MGTDGSQSEWLVKEKGDKLLLTINGETLDIMKPLTEHGYYYDDYTDQSDVLHRVYIVKNAGAKKIMLNDGIPNLNGYQIRVSVEVIGELADRLQQQS